MAHTIFHVANQIIPIPTPKSLPFQPSLPPPQTSVYRPLPVRCKLRKGIVVKASSPSVADGDAISGLERCFISPPSSDSPASSSSTSAVVCGPVMEGGTDLLVQLGEIEARHGTKAEQV